LSETKKSYIRERKKEIRKINKEINKKINKNKKIAKPRGRAQK